MSETQNPPSRGIRSHGPVSPDINNYIDQSLVANIAANNSFPFFQLPRGKFRISMLLRYKFQPLIISKAVRNRIYEILYLRPVGIIPCRVRSKDDETKYGQALAAKIMRYHWDGHPQVGYSQDGLPSYNGKPQKMDIVWQAAPNKKQAAMISRGDYITDLESNRRCFPSYWHEGLQAQVTAFIHVRKNNGTVIINRASAITTGIQGWKLLMTCQHALKEAAPVLYSNTFVFDSRGQEPYTHALGLHPQNAFDTRPQDIPGLVLPNGVPQASWQIWKAIDKLFNTSAGVHHTAFIYRDPFVKFIRHIGRINAGYLKDVKFIGNLKTAEKRPKTVQPAPIGLGRLLPIYTAIMSRVCPNITKLTLHQGERANFWDDDLKGLSGISDDAKIHFIVENVVYGLQKLTEFNLVNYKNAPKEENHDSMWGSSMKFVGFVRERYQKSQARIVRNKEKEVAARNRFDGKKVADLAGIDHSIQVDFALAALNFSEKLKEKVVDVTGNVTADVDAKQMNQEVNLVHQGDENDAVIIHRKPNFRKGKKNAGMQRR